MKYPCIIIVMRLYCYFHPSGFWFTFDKMLTNCMLPPFTYIGRLGEPPCTFIGRLGEPHCTYIGRSGEPPCNFIGRLGEPPRTYIGRST